MRVICIKKCKKATSGRTGLPSPEVGDEDIVTREKKEFGIDWYFLERFGDQLSYAKDHFSPLSDLDETTLVNEEFEEKYCVPVNS